jgi:hypothetical protein
MNMDGIHGYKEVAAGVLVSPELVKMSGSCTIIVDEMREAVNLAEETGSEQSLLRALTPRKDLVKVIRFGCDRRDSAGVLLTGERVNMAGGLVYHKDTNTWSIHT